MTKKHINVVCAVVSDGNTILCAQRLRRGPAYTAEHWEMPGGKIEAGETAEEALRREMREEMDWDVYVGKELASVDYDYPDFSITLTAFDCMARDHNYKLFAHVDARWLKPEEMTELNWTAADRLLLEKIFDEKTDKEEKR